MNEKELMIGNWVNHKSINIQLNRTDFCDNTFLRNIKPIPLTSDLLVKFGFEKRKDGRLRWYQKNDIDIDVELYKDGRAAFFTYTNLDKEITVASVHQLQNLYFALTGKELCLNKS